MAMRDSAFYNSADDVELYWQSRERASGRPGALLPWSKREPITQAESVHGPARAEIFAQYNYAHTHQHEVEQWPLRDSHREYGEQSWRSRANNERALDNAQDFPNSDTRAQNFRGLAPRNYNRADTRIREDICERLTEDPDVDASDIAVDVQAGIAMLSGTVTERRQKYRAELIADSVRGVRDIDNRLSVQRAETFG